MINEINEIKKDIKENILSVINEYYYCENFMEIARASFSALYIDPLDEVEMVMELEERLKISLPDEELTNLKTPLDLFSLIATKLLSKEQLTYLSYVEKIKGVLKRLNKATLTQHDAFSLIRDLMVSCSAYTGNKLPICVEGFAIFPMPDHVKELSQICDYVRPLVPINNTPRQGKVSDKPKDSNREQVTLCELTRLPDDPKRVRFSVPDYDFSDVNYKGVNIKPKEGNEE